MTREGRFLYNLNDCQQRELKYIIVMTYKSSISRMMMLGIVGRVVWIILVRVETPVLTTVVVGVIVLRIVVLRVVIVGLVVVISTLVVPLWQIWSVPSVVLWMVVGVVRRLDMNVILIVAVVTIVLGAAIGASHIEIFFTVLCFWIQRRSRKICSLQWKECVAQNEILKRNSESVQVKSLGTIIVGQARSYKSLQGWLRAGSS